MKLKFLAFAAAAFLAACSFGSEPAKAQPTPVACQWNYAMLPPDSVAQTATATYCGNVVVNGSITGQYLNYVTSMTALRALTSAQQISLGNIGLTGWYSGSAKGGGMFIYLTAAQAAGLTPDQNIVIAPSNNSSDCNLGCLSKQLPNETVTPFDFGAKGDGTTDDGSAMLLLANYVAARGCNGKPLTVEGSLGKFFSATYMPFQSACNTTFNNLSVGFIAGADYSHSVLEFGNGSSGVECTIGGFWCLRNVTFNNLYVDAAHRGGCLSLNLYLNVTINHMQGAHYGSATGNTVCLDTSDLNSHELTIDQQSHFDEYFPCEGSVYCGIPGASPTCYAGSAVTCYGTAIRLVPNDNYILGATVVATSLNGFVIDGQNNSLDSTHDYSVNGSHVTVNGPGLSWTNAYIDGNTLQIDNPYRMTFSTAKVYGTNLTNGHCFIKLKSVPTFPATAVDVSGFNFVNSSFLAGIAAGTVDSFCLDISLGGFTNNITQSNIKDNIFQSAGGGSINPAYTELSMQASENTGFHTFDFSNVFPLGIIEQASGSFLIGAANAPAIISLNQNADKQITMQCGVVTLAASPNPVLNAGDCNGTYAVHANVNIP